MEPDHSRHATGITLRELAERCGAELAGNGELMIYRVATLEDADAKSISFLSNTRYRAQLASTRAGAVIVAQRDAEATPLPKLVTSNPYAVYARIAAIFHPPAVAVPGVHPTAIVAATAKVAADFLKPDCEGARGLTDAEIAKLKAISSRAPPAAPPAPKP